MELLFHCRPVRATIILYPIGRPVRATITLYPIGRPVRATITLYPIGRPVRATIILYPIGTLYPIGRSVRATITLYPIGYYSTLSGDNKPYNIKSTLIEMRNIGVTTGKQELQYFRPMVCSFFIYSRKGISKFISKHNSSYNKLLFIKYNYFS